MTRSIHRFVIPFVSLLAVLPILVNGPSCGHDFDFHLLSWLEAASQFAHLHYPHWAYTPAWNAGEPRFLFYPPLSWTLGALLGLMLPWTLVPAAFTFCALILAGFTAHRLAARYAGEPAATLAAAVYLVNPYMLFTAYERTAYGELLAAAWLPLLLLEALAPRIRPVALAVPIALLWLSNAPAGVMGCYALAFLTLVRLLLPAATRKSGLALAAVTATVLGLTLSAFYLLPAATERRYIQSDMAVIEGMRIADNTLFHHMPPSDDNALHDAVLHTASSISVGLLAAIALCVLALLLKRRKLTPLLPLLCLFLFIAFLLTPLSLSIWSHTPQLKFLQFPWRLAAILEAIAVVLLAMVVDRLRVNPWLTVLLSLVIAGAMIYPAWHTFQQPCDDEDAVAPRVALFHSTAGTEPTDEYTPTNADNEALKQGDPPYWLIPADQPVDTPAPAGAQPGQAPSHLILKLTQPEYLVLNRRQYPGWRLRLNGHAVDPSPNGRDDGLLTVLLPAGTDLVDDWFTWNLAEELGLGISGLALLAAAGMQRRARIR